jgi:hypothetical protein
MIEPRTFVRDSNNSLTAVMLLEDYARMRENPDNDDTGPIFLFYPDEICGLPHRGREPWITGDYSLMNTLLAGHTVVSRDIGIPFSNGHQLYETREALLLSFRKIGSVAEAIEIFGLHRPAGELRMVDGKIVDDGGNVIFDLANSPTFA